MLKFFSPQAIGAAAASGTSKVAAAVQSGASVAATAAASAAGAAATSTASSGLGHTLFVVFGFFAAFAAIAWGVHRLGGISNIETRVRVMLGAGAKGSRRGGDGRGAYTNLPR